MLQMDFRKGKPCFQISENVGFLCFNNIIGIDFR